QAAEAVAEEPELLRVPFHLLEQVTRARALRGRRSRVLQHPRELPPRAIAEAVPETEGCGERRAAAPQEKEARRARVLVASRAAAEDPERHAGVEQGL